MKVALVLTLMVCAATLFTRGTARADDHYVTVEHCDSVSVGGHLARMLSFKIHDSGAYVIYSFRICPDTAVPADTCHPFTALAPANWTADVQPDGCVDFEATNPAGIIPLGGDLDGFKMSVSGFNCCFAAPFETSFIGAFAVDNFCVECPLATATRSGTWGSIKAAYR